MPQLPRQFAQGVADTTVSQPIPQSIAGQGLQTLGQGFQAAGLAVRNLAQGLQDDTSEVGVLEASLAFNRDLAVFMTSLDEADDFRNLGADALDGIDRIVKQYQQDVGTQFGEAAVESFLKRIEPDATAAINKVGERITEIGDTEALLRFGNARDLAIQKGDADALTEAYQFVVTKGVIPGDTLQKAFREDQERIKLNPQFERANTNPIDVLNDIQSGRIDGTREAIEELETEAIETLNFQNAQEDRLTRMDTAMEEKMTDGYKLEIQDDLSRILSEVPPGEQLRELDDLMRKANRTVKTYDAETGVRIVSIKEDAVALMQDAINSARNQIIEGKNEINLDAMNKYRNQIDVTMTIPEAFRLKDAINRDVDLGQNPKSALIKEINAVINSEFPREQKNQIASMKNRLKIDSLFAPVVPEAQLFTDLAVQEFRQKVRENMDRIRRGELSFFDIAQPIVKRTQGLIKDAFMIDVEKIRPLVNDRLKAYDDMNKMRESLNQERAFASPQKMIAAELERGEISPSRARLEIAYLDLMETYGADFTPAAPTPPAPPEEEGRTPDLEGGTIRSTIEGVTQTIKDWRKAAEDISRKGVESLFGGRGGDE